MKKRILPMIALAFGAFAMTSCSGTSANLANVYVSTNNMDYSNFLPQFNYYFETTTTQQIEVYDDDTYILTVNTSTFSNISLGPDVAAGEETHNDRGQNVYKLYGECTIEATADYTTISLDSVTRFVQYGLSSNTDENGVTTTSVTFHDTDNWSEDSQTLYEVTGEEYVKALGDALAALGEAKSVFTSANAFDYIPELTTLVSTSPLAEEAA